MTEKHLSNREADAALAKAGVIPVKGIDSLRVHRDFPNALRAVSDLMDWGETKHPDEEWKGQNDWDHVDHACTHLWTWRDLDCETGRSHLVHACCRLLMSLEVQK